ncbi:hypothetical protein F4553_002082 [Allocatelliglobosispora scoriae]|uniref:Uncharacterized protein n=1 Tax=Allocatelliglobosispora scoriae TaxID=643052 RepID=A0A841BP24_9ACTN|nr:hypothetical protein [Allocatelliglobosispora scoriae]MBB5868703.1 hypothetical protein [Allocatelliglobosispora scoriae]
MQQTYRRAAVVAALIVTTAAGYLTANAQHTGTEQDRVPATVPINAYDTTPVSSPAPPRNA